VLSDDEKKGRYDRGEDVNGQPQQQGHPGGFPGGASTH
jgi:DnaJ-class molecular chaperone